MVYQQVAVRGIIAGAVAAMVAAGPALAALSASVANLTLPAVAFSNEAQVSSGTMTLTATDTAFPVGVGWNVTIQASAFLYTGPNNGASIPASNLALTSAADPVRVSGQAIDAVNGPKVPAASPLGTLDAPRKVLQANPLFGVGTYAQVLGVSLIIPAQARTGTYTTSLTTTISAGP
jgi:hypothetical protein